MTDSFFRPLGSRYLLHERVGSGPTGQVWRASIRATGKPVAAKVLKSSLSTNPRIVARFLHERSHLTTIAHPNVIRVLDVVIESHTLAIVMDLVDATDLREMIEASGPLPPPTAVEITVAILSGLEAIHSEGLVHGSVKPENVLFENVGRPQKALLSDAGIAWIISQETGDIPEIKHSSAYLAPEGGAGAGLVPATDLYATGAVLYELLLGRSPASDRDEGRHGLSLPESDSGVSGRLVAVVNALLARDPVKRPQTAQMAKNWLLSLEGEERSLPFRHTPKDGEEDGPLAHNAQTLIRRLPGRDSEAPPPTEGDVPRHWPWVLATLGVVAALLAGILAIVSLPDRRAASTATAVSTPLRQPDGLAISRVLELSGNGGDHLKVEVTITNDTDKPFTGGYEEVLPKSVASSIDGVRFRPNYDELVERDPIVQYQLDRLAPGASFHLVYELPVPQQGLLSERLEVWSTDQERDTERRVLDQTKKLPARLADVQVPTPVDIRVNEAHELGITGTLSDQTLASDALLSGLAISSSDPSIVEVRGEAVNGRRPGRAAVNIQAGQLKRSVQVTVAP